MKIQKDNQKTWLILLACTVLGIYSSSCHAGANQLFTIDASSFKQSDGYIYQEIYLMIQRNRLQFVQAVEGYEAEYQIKIDLINRDSLLSTTSWEVVDRALQLEDITPRQKLPDIVVFTLAPGKYKVDCTVTDLNMKASFTKTLSLDLAAFPEDNVAISDIELANRLTKGEKGSKFYKNGFLVIPNPEKIYGPSLSTLYYYSEIYNLEPGDGEYTVERMILNDSKEMLNKLPSKTRGKAGSSVVEVDGFSINTLSSGTYYLRIIASDNDTKETDSAETKFFIYRPDDFTGEKLAVRGRLNANEVEFNAMTPEELDEAISELKYFLGDSDWRTVENLNTDGKRQYLIKFWSENDPEPGTPSNEFRQLMLDRKKYANDKYGLWKQAGWKTDRGRVYMLYGEPEYIEYHTHDPGTRSYQVWFYDSLEGGVQFIFVDRNNFGDFRLVHSSKEGELYRPNWYEEEALVRRP